MGQQEIKKYQASYVKCDICGYKWTAVRPEGTKTLECANCKQNCNFENLKTK